MKNETNEKYCPRCKKTKPIGNFYKNKSCRDGLSAYCKLYWQKWRKNNKKKLKKYYKKWEENNKEKRKEQYEKWMSENLELYRKLRREWMRRRRKDHKYRLDCNMATVLCKALKGNKKGRKWEKLVGYSLEDLKNHLEEKFTDKMSWDNYGGYWWIDHIKPKSLFNYKTAEENEFLECWSLDNLQPMEKIRNIKKSNSYEP